MKFGVWYTAGASHELRDRLNFGAVYGVLSAVLGPI